MATQQHRHTSVPTGTSAPLLTRQEYIDALIAVPNKPLRKNEAVDQVTAVTPHLNAADRQQLLNHRRTLIALPPLFISTTVLAAQALRQTHHEGAYRLSVVSEHRRTPYCGTAYEYARQAWPQELMPLEALRDPRGRLLHVIDPAALDSTGQSGPRLHGIAWATSTGTQLLRLATEVPELNELLALQSPIIGPVYSTALVRRNVCMHCGRSLAQETCVEACTASTGGSEYPAHFSREQLWQHTETVILPMQATEAGHSGG
jgi:hypothetical protein